MTWTLEFLPSADKALGRIDGAAAGRILNELEEISRLEDPRSRGRAAAGNLAGLWRYRVGDYRVICDIEDDALVVLVVGVTHRSEVYRRR